MSGLKSYLAKLEACLSDLPPSARQDVMEELRGHLEDRAAALQANGLEEEASMSEAIERFSEAREIGAALQDVHGRGSWGEALAGIAPFLVIGLTLSGIVVAIGNAIYWHGRQEFWMKEPGNGYETARGMLIGLGVLVALMLAPALLGLFRRSVRSTWAA